MINVMGNGRIDPRVEIGYVRLQVADITRALAFYERMLGFGITQRIGQSTVLLGTGDHDVQIQLDSTPAGGSSRDSAPACRFSIRYPDRNALADAWRRLLDAGADVQGAEDRGIRETVFLQDPDGNAIELYCDRPSQQWPLNGDGTVRLTAEPLDVESLRTSTPIDRSQGTSTAPPDAPRPLSQPTRERLRDMRVRLLNLHKALLEDAKAAYEMDRGKVPSSASLLQLVINDPWFAWLHPLSELVVRMDETLQADAPATESDGNALLEHVGRLLSPGHGADAFAQRYFEALQRQPAVIVAHAEVRRILKQTK